MSAKEISVCFILSRAVFYLTLHLMYQLHVLKYKRCSIDVYKRKKEKELTFLPSQQFISDMQSCSIRKEIMSVISNWILKREISA